MDKFRTVSDDAAGVILNSESGEEGFTGTVSGKVCAVAPFMLKMSNSRKSLNSGFTNK